MADQSTMHQSVPVYGFGAPLEEATVAVIVIHGRAGPAPDILALAQEIDVPGVANVGPAIAPGVLNDELWLSSALAAVGEVVDMVSSAGIPRERTLLLGFSQGACLLLEYAARNPRRYGGVIGFSGTLVENGDKPRYNRDSGSFDGTPVFLGCSDDDPHVSESRVQRTAGLLTGLGAEVTMRIYPGMGHTINPHEYEVVRNMVTTVVAGHRGT
ncbi:MAG TPA: dienelactone hydrolase family protein [Chloroflexia bacterium]|nr:dienelactone hydrolase family protein [Chloroflexia bacterium]